MGPANRRSYRLYDVAKHGGAVAALYSFLHSAEMLKYISQVSNIMFVKMKMISFLRCLAKCAGDTA